MKEGVRGQELAIGKVGLELVGAPAETQRVVARGHDQFGADAVDVAGVHVVAEVTLQADLQVAGAALTTLLTAEIGHLERQRDFDLILRAEAEFPEKLMDEGVPVAALQPRGQHHLVLRIGLLRKERPRQIEFAPRPSVVRALCAHMVQDGLYLIRFQRVAERRHHLVEAPHRPAGVYDRVPVGIRLPGREIAVRKVRHHQIQESELRDAVARTVAAVARRTSGVVQLLAGFLRQTG